MTARADLDLHVGHAAHAEDQRWPARGEHHGVADDHVIGAQLLAMRRDPRREVGRADLLFTLEEQDQVDRQTGGLQRRFGGGDLEHDLGLVVRGAAGHEVVAHPRQLERRRAPLGKRIGGLDVVVRVDQERRSVRARMMAPDYERVSGGLFDRRLEPRHRHASAHPSRGLAHFFRASGVGGDARNGDELREVVVKALEVVRDPGIGRRRHSCAQGTGEGQPFNLRLGGCGTRGALSCLS